MNVIAAPEFASTNAARLQYQDAYAEPASVTLSGPAGGEQTLTLTYTDTDGAGLIAYGQIVVNPNTGAASLPAACYLAWDNAGDLDLLDESQSPVSVYTGRAGQAGPAMSDAYCTVNPLHSSVTGSGTTVIVALAVTFPASFAGLHEVYSYGQNVAGLATGLVDLGTVTTGAGLTIMTTSLPTATVGTSYSVSFAGNGGATPYTWSVVSGSLPAGLSLSAGGILSGPAMATALGGGSITVRLTDNAGQITTSSYSLVVQAGQISTRAVAPSDFTYPDGIGRTYSFYVCDVNGYGCYYTDTVSSCTVDTTVAVSVVASHTTFAAKFTASTNAIAGARTVTCRWVAGTFTINLADALQVYDATPNVTSIQQLSPLYPGGQAYVAIYGTNFGPA